MKKVLFLMFLLFLIGLGTVGVKAQVRIGGNTSPNGAAMLDLNATDATNNGTKGLALPRVNLTSNTMQLTSGVANLNGMMVYNTTASLGAGVYTWSGSAWTKVGGITTVPADSGKLLMSTGSATTWINTGYSPDSYLDTVPVYARRDTLMLSTVLDTVIAFRMMPRSSMRLIAPGVSNNALCTLGLTIGGVTPHPTFNTYTGWIRFFNPNSTSNNDSYRIRCFHLMALKY